jgi:hypothetical protein
VTARLTSTARSRQRRVVTRIRVQLFDEQSLTRAVAIRWRRANEFLMDAVV